MWQNGETPHGTRCGLCPKTLDAHHLTRYPSGWVAMCAPDVMSDIVDQQLLEQAANGAAR